MKASEIKFFDFLSLYHYEFDMSQWWNC